MSGTTGATAEAARRPFFAANRLPIGLQLYTLGPDAARDLDATLTQVAAMGYRTVEFPSFFGKTGPQLRASLDKAGLTCRAAHVQARGMGPGVPSLDGDLSALADTLAAIGVKTAVAPSLRAPDRFLGQPGGMLRRIAELTADDWKSTARFLNGVGRTMKARGIRVGYHNHNFEFARHGDATGMDILLKETDPDLVTFEIDVGWVRAAGADPVALMARHKGRFSLMHVKDIKATTTPNTELKMEPTEVGSGAIEWRTLLPAAYAAGVREYYVEQEPPFTRPRAEAAKLSHDFLASLVV